MVSLRQLMTKVAILFVFLYAGYLAMHPVKAETVTETIFNEDFESGWGNWSADNGIWEIGTPQAGPKGSHGGSQCAATVLNGDYTIKTDSRLISPSITLSNVTGDEELSLRFWHWFSYDIYDAGYVQISYDTSDGWSDWETLGNAIKDVSNVWSYKKVDLSGYFGKKIRIGFYHTSDDNYFVSEGWYIDDVEITGISIEPTPIPTPDPSPTPVITPIPTPTPTLCKAEKMTADSKKMHVSRGSSALETITITCEDGISAVGELVAWKIIKGKKNISITPESAATDAHGRAEFTIKGVKDGKAIIKFKSGDLKTKVKVTVTVTE